ncbi:hypothetical protein C0Q70_20477 [Pomacea canaliculata]|uniref:Uncharacterized protein n=1 Tax=Pomacea canaliculata TaxID=400727 RepID=A0A2T7NFM9_POMCA|nr:hypothetical protein C0Q70_20477 [Pomacea canaliculata]
MYDVGPQGTPSPDPLAELHRLMFSDVASPAVVEWGMKETTISMEPSGETSSHNVMRLEHEQPGSSNYYKDPGTPFSTFLKESTIPLSHYIRNPATPNVQHSRDSNAALVSKVIEAAEAFTRENALQGKRTSEHSVVSENQNKHSASNQEQEDVGVTTKSATAEENNASPSFKTRPMPALIRDPVVVPLGKREAINKETREKSSERREGKVKLLDSKGSDHHSKQGLAKQHAKDIKDKVKANWERLCESNNATKTPLLSVRKEGLREKENVDKERRSVQLLPKPKAVKRCGQQQKLLDLGRSARTSGRQTAEEDEKKSCGVRGRRGMKMSAKRRCAAGRAGSQDELTSDITPKLHERRGAWVSGGTDVIHVDKDEEDDVFTDVPEDDGTTALHLTPTARKSEGEFFPDLSRTPSCGSSRGSSSSSVDEGDSDSVESRRRLASTCLSRTSSIGSHSDEKGEPIADTILPTIFPPRRQSNEKVKTADLLASFHEHQLRCLELEGQHYVVLEEVLSKCFPGLPRAQVERARLRDLNLLTRTLHLLGPGLAPEGSDSVSVLALADAAQLLHFFHGMMPCPGKDCMLTAPKPRGHLLETAKAAAGASPSVCHHDKVGQRSRRSSSEGQHRFAVSESATFRKSSLSGRSKLDSMASDEFDGNEEDAHSFTSEKTLFYCDGHPIFVYEDDAMAEQEQGTSDGEHARSPISSFKRGKIRRRASSYETDGEIMSVKEFKEKSGFGYRPNSPDVYRSYPEVGDASPMLPSIPVYLSSPYTPGGGSLCHMPMDNERVLLECFSAPGSMAPSSVRSAPSVRLLSPDRPDLPPYEEDVFEGFPNNRITSETEYNHADLDPTDDLATPNAPANFLHEQLGKTSVPDIVVQPAHVHRNKYLDIGTHGDVASSEEPCSMHDPGEDKKFKNISGDISKCGSQQVDESLKGAYSWEKTVHRVEGLRSKRETSPGNIHERLSRKVAASETEKHANERKNEDGKFSAKKSSKSKKKDETKMGIKSGSRDREKESKLAKDIVRRLRAVAKNGEKGSTMLVDTATPSSESTSTGSVCSATTDVMSEKGVSRPSVTLTSDNHVTTKSGITIAERGQPAPVIPGKGELLPTDTLALVRKSSDTTTIAYGTSDEEVETASRAGSIQTASSDGDLAPEQLQSSAPRHFPQKVAYAEALMLSKTGPTLDFKESDGNPPTSEKFLSPRSVPVCTRIEDFINQGSEYMSDAVGLVRSHSEPSLHSKSGDKVSAGLQVTGGSGRGDALVPPGVTVRSNSFPGASHSPKHLSEEEFIKNPPAPLLRMCGDMPEPSAQDDPCHSAPSLSPCTEITIETSKDNQDVHMPRVKAGAELHEMALTPVGAKQTGSPIAEQVEREQPYDWTMPCAAHGEVCCPCEGLDVETVLDNVASPKVGPWLCTPGDELLYRCYSPRHLSMCASPRHSVAYMSPRHSTVCYSPRHSSSCYSPRPPPISYSPRPSPLAATSEELKTLQEETTLSRHEPSRLTVQVPGHDSAGSGVKRFASPNELPAAKRRPTEVQQKHSAAPDQVAEPQPGSPQTHEVSHDLEQPAQPSDSDLHHLATSGVNIQEVHAHQTEEVSLDKSDKLSVNLRSSSDTGHLHVDSVSDMVDPGHPDAEQSHPPKSLVPTGTSDLSDSQTMNSKSKSLVMPVDSAKLNISEADAKTVSSALAASDIHENISDVSLATPDTYKNLTEASFVSETKMTCTETLEIKIITLSEDTRTKMTLTKMVSTKVTPTTTLGVLTPSHVEGELEEIETPVVVKPNILNSPRVKSPSKDSSPDFTLARTVNQNSDQREKKIGLSLTVESNDFVGIEGEERRKTGGHRLADTVRASRSERRRHSASADSSGHVTRCNSMHSDLTPKMTVELKRSHSCDIEHPAVKRFKYNKEEVLDFSGLPTLERQSFMSEAFKRLYKQEGLRECMKTAAGLYLQPMTGVYLHDMTVGYVEHVTSSRDPPEEDTPSSQCAAPPIENEVVSSGCESQTSCTSGQTGQPDPAPPLAPMDTMSQSEVSESRDADCSRATPIDDVEEALHQVQLSSSMSESHPGSESIADKDEETLAEEVKPCCPGDAAIKSPDDDRMDETNVPCPEGESARAPDHVVAVVDMNDRGEDDSCRRLMLTDDLEDEDDSAADCDHDTMSLDSGEEVHSDTVAPVQDVHKMAMSDDDDEDKSEKPMTDSGIIMPVIVEKDKYLPEVSGNEELMACTDVEPGEARGIEASQAPSTSPVMEPSADNSESLCSQNISVTQESKQNHDPLTPEIQHESVPVAEQTPLRVDILGPGSPRGSLTEENTNNAKLHRNSETPQEEYPIAPESQDGSGVESDETRMSPVSKSNSITSDISDGQSVTEDVDGCLAGQHRDEAADFSPVSERAETEVNVSGDERPPTPACDVSRGVSGGESDLDGQSTNDSHLHSEPMSPKPSSEGPPQVQNLDLEQHVQAANVQNTGDRLNTSDPLPPEETATVLSQVSACAAPGTSGTNTASTDLAASSVGNVPPRAGEESEVTGACSRPPRQQDTQTPSASQPSEGSEDFRMKAYLLEKMVEG